MPILARFYCQLLDGQSTAADFIECAKACAAFFTLWRSSNSTSGLDEVYRRYFRGNALAKGCSWRERPDALDVGQLKSYFADALTEKEIASRQGWIRRSARFLLYSELRTICRFALFVAAHDRIPDSTRPGLTAAGTKGSCTMLTLDRWLGKDCKTLEHVAPQAPPKEHTWGSEIYEDDTVHQPGNLLLLPLDVNQVADNKSWKEKYFHYCHVGERDKSRLAQLEKKAKASGVPLSERAIEVLSEMQYVCAVEPILSVTDEGVWDGQVVAERTAEIKELVWSTLSSWLDLG